MRLELSPTPPSTAARSGSVMSPPDLLQVAPDSDAPDGESAQAGAPPEALVGSELSMSLDDVTILDWVQAIQIFARHAIITVLHADGESRIWCSEGAVIDACSGRLRGEAAFHRIASIEQGRVSTDLRPVHRERTIRTSPTWLLLEAARRKDERAQLERKLGGLERHLHAAKDAVPSLSLEGAQAALLRRFDAPRAVGDVLAESELGDTETLAALDALIRAGLLVDCTVGGDAVARDVAGREGATDGLALRRAPAHAVDSTVTRMAFVAQTPARSGGRWRWAAAALATGSLVAAAVWLATPASLAKAPAALAPPAAPPTAFSFAVRAIPAEAELRLDGQFAGRGVWRAQLPRDGVAHELRVSAEGFLPLRVLFVDTPPPAEIRLEPQPLVSTPAAAHAECAAPTPGARTVAIESNPARRASPPPRRSAAGPLVRHSARAAAKAQPVRKQPWVRIIDEDGPAQPH